MLISSIPAKFNIPFANSAGAGFIRPIPEASQIGIQAGAASLTDGFPPVNFLPIGAGGTPPWGEDFNGLLNQITAWSRWVQAGAPVAYDSAFSTAISGYPLGALVASATTFGTYWLSQVDGNTSNPDAGGANWQQLSLLGAQTTGTWAWRPTSETLPGFIKANATTLGNTGSGATQLADSSAAAIFAWFWNNFSNSLCVVSGGRGANAAADFAALKTISTLDMRGYGIIGMDTMGGGATTRLAGVPVGFGAATQAGSSLGEILHALILAELATHNHGVTDPTHNHGHSDPGHIHGINDPTHSHTVTGGVFGGQNTGQAGTSGSSPPIDAAFIAITANSTGISVQSNTTGMSNVASATGVTVNNAGSGTAHNNVPLSFTGTHYFHL